MPRFRALDSAKEYKIAWITALTIELAAAIALLDEQHSQPANFVRNNTDDNIYVWGNISGHNIVILSLSEGQYGLTNATSVAERLRTSLPHIRIGLLVGIGAGVPNGNNIRFGDVAVSLPDGTTGGVVQYDFGKAESNGFKRIGMLSDPPRVLLSALRLLRAQHDLQDPEISSLLKKAMDLNPKFAKKYGYPGAKNDYLPQTPNYSNEARAREVQSSPEPSIHYGTIASGNVVVKNVQMRDSVVAAVGKPCICIETEAAGLMNTFPCLVIRGICDYADGNKNDTWQPYASATAAAFAKELLQYVPETEVEMANDLKHTLQGIQAEISELDTNLKQVGQKAEQKSHEETVAEYIQTIFSHSHTERKDRNPKRVDGTGKWFVEHPLFRQWNKGLGSQTLWVSADPGCGKSVLAKYLIDKVLVCKDRIICYFFFKDDFVDQKVASISVRTILYQLFSVNQSLITESMLKNFKTYGKETLDSFSKLWQMFLTASQDSHTEIVCVFDGLDECRAKDTSEFIGAICGADPFPALPNKLKIIALSRPYFHIHNAFSKIASTVPILHLSGNSDQERELISAEIDLVIKHRIDLFCKQKRLSQADHDFLSKEFMSTTHKTYLWAHLTLAFLEETPGFNRGDARDICKNLPPTVDIAYEKILDRSIDKRKTRLLLQIVIAAERPLSVNSMCLLLAFNNTQTNYDQLLDYIEPDDQFKNTIRELCGLFVIVVDGKVYLLHQTAREFLLENAANQGRHAMIMNSPISEPFKTGEYGTVWKQSFSSVGSHEKLAERCIWFVKSYDYPYKNLELYSYCASFWTIHFRQSSSEFKNELVHLVLDSCINDLKCCKSWFGTFWEREKDKLYMAIDSSDMWSCLKYSPSSFPLKIASLVGLTPILQQYLKGDLKQDWSQTTLSEALWYALHSGYLDTAEALVHAGADSNAYCSAAIPELLESIESQYAGYGKITSNLEGQHPLDVAIARHFDGAVQLLLQYGADAEHISENGNFLCTAIGKRAPESTLKLLLKHNVKVNGSIGNRIPLCTAIELGAPKSTIQVLLEHEADPMMVEEGRNNALTLFYFQRHEDRDCDGIRQLFKTLAPRSLNDFDVNDRKNHYFNFRSSPLLSSSTHERCLSCVKDLLQREHTIDCKDDYGYTPLHRLLDRTIYDADAVALIVIELLQAGTNIHARTDTGETALLTLVHQTCWQEDVFKILLDKGANIHDMTTDGSNSLHLVRSVQGLDRLISHGLDINSCDEAGQTPLLSYISHQYNDKRYVCMDDQTMFELMRHMVGSGARVDITDHMGRTAVMLYCSSKSDYHTSCREVLTMLCNGYSDMIRQLDVSGTTALHCCLSGPRGLACHACVEFLVENGADINSQNIVGETVTAVVATWSSSDLCSQSRFGNSSYQNYETHYKIIRLLMNSGAKTNTVDMKGDTPLHAALPTGPYPRYERQRLEQHSYGWFAPERYMDIPRLLIEHGADVNAIDGKGRTFLSKLCSVPFMDAANLRFMLSKGADPDIKDNIGKTALDYLKDQISKQECSKSKIQACIDLLESQ